MLDPYREEMMDKNFNTFTFGGHLNFEAYVQYEEYGGFTKAMDTLRSMKLMLKGDDGKAVACNIKVGESLMVGCHSSKTLQGTLIMSSQFLFFSQMGTIHLNIQF